MEIAVGGVSPPPRVRRTPSPSPSPSPTTNATATEAAAETATESAMEAETEAEMQAEMRAEGEAVVDTATTALTIDNDTQGPRRDTGAPDNIEAGDRKCDASKQRRESEASASGRANDEYAGGRAGAGGHVSRSVDVAASADKYASSMAALSPSDAGVETVGTVLRREAEERARREVEAEEQARQFPDEGEQRDSGLAAAAAPRTPPRPPVNAAAASSNSSAADADAASGARAGGGVPAVPRAPGAADDVGAHSPLGRHVLPPARGSVDEGHPMHHTSSVQALELFC